MLVFISKAVIRMPVIVKSVFGQSAKSADPVDGKQAGACLFPGESDYAVFRDS
jgi:hypothetical protein